MQEVLTRTALLALALLALPSAAHAAHRVALPVSVANGGTTSTQATEWVGAAADGSSAFFVTRERLIEADTDDHLDIYRRRGAELSLVSAAEAGVESAPADAAMPADARVPITPDGEHVVFHTA